MKANRHFCFTHASGEDIYLFKLTNSKGTEVSISNYGAIITSFSVRQPDGVINDIVLGFDRMEDYFNDAYLSAYPWFGAAIGRYGNRIGGACFTIDKTTYQLTKNSGPNQLHGGHEGFDKKIWTVINASTSTLELSYKSNDGEEGFPGSLVISLRYELNDANELSYEFNAHTDKPTAVNLTHHSYFNLDTVKSSIANHQIRIAATHLLEQDENLVTTGRIVDIRDTDFDFRQFKQPGQSWDPATGYDQSFVTEKDKKNFSLVAEAKSEQSGLAMEIWSTEPVVHFYTGVWIPSLKGKDGVQYGPYSGFCLETQVHPNAINIPHFPNTILRPGETYHHKTLYKVIP